MLVLAGNTGIHALRHYYASLLIRQVSARLPAGSCRRRLAGAICSCRR
jgi:hypothetical protein